MQIARHIRFRFYATILGLVLLVGFFLDTRPLLLQLLQLNATKKSLFKQYDSEKKLLRQQIEVSFKLNNLSKETLAQTRFDNKSAITAELITTILRASEMNGVLIYTIQPELWQEFSGMNTLSIHVIASGHFLQFVRFLAVLSQYSLSISCQDFSFRIDKNGVGQIDMYLLGMYIPSMEKTFPIPLWKKTIFVDLQKQRDPFVDVNETNVELTNQSPNMDLIFQSTSLQQIKWAGYLHDHNRFWALAKLPNGSTVPVVEKMQIGLERAEVLSLNEEKIVLLIANRKIQMKYSI